MPDVGLEEIVVGLKLRELSEIRPSRHGTPCRNRRRLRAGLDRSVLLRGGPLAGCLLFMAAATCLSADFFSFNAGTLRLTIDRVFWGVVMLLYLVWRQRGWTDPKPLQAADKAALALVAYLAVRTLLTDPHGTGLTPVVNLILWYVMPLGIYWVVRQSRIDRPQNTMILACLALFGIYLAVTVIAERFEAYWLVYPRYIVTSMSDKTAEFVGRGRGPLLHPIVTGIQLAACFSAVLMFWPRWGGWGRCGVALAAAVFALAFYSTMTRSVWMGAGLGLAVIAGLSMPCEVARARAGGGRSAGRSACGSQLGAVRGLQTRQEPDGQGNGRFRDPAAGDGPRGVADGARSAPVGMRFWPVFAGT